jgi:hypothetical protein
MLKRTLALFLCLSIAGCASLNGEVPFRYTSSLVPVGQTINKTVSVSEVIDARPDIDKAYTRSISDVTEKITAKLIEDFQKSGIFSGVHFGKTESDELILSPRVNRFIWKLYASPISYIPFVCLLALFGAPCYTAYGIADITLEITDNKTGALIATLNESSRIESNYTLYDMKAGEYGAELSDAFREVTKKLKEDILRNKNLYK